MASNKIIVKDYIYAALQTLKPPEHLSVSKWAEKHRMLDAKSSAMPGRWRNDVTPYLIGIMDEFNNRETEEIILCKPTQFGGSEALNNIIGYIISQDPAPTMVVYPSEQLAKSIAENRIKPMISLSEELSEKYDPKSSTLEMQFKGMYLSLTGSNSPANLSSKPIKYLLMDEVDKYPDSAGKEADPIKLAEERVKAFYNSKIYMTSTPTTREGHIWQAKETADIEKHYFVPCPHCGEYIELVFSNIKFPDEDGMTYADRAEFAVYVCQKCGCIIRDGDKPKMLRNGEWRIVRHSTQYARKVAFWINTLYSPFVRWSQIAKEFLFSKDQPEEFQNFTNSWLAEPWEDSALKTSVDLVMERQTDIPALAVPDWAELLTAGVDVQETSLYWTIRAWGKFLTSQNIAHGQALSFEEIDRVMNLEYKKADGSPFLVKLCLIDSGDQTDTVYDFCLEHADWALPVKGSSHAQLSHYKISKVNREGSSVNGMMLVLVDGGKYKDMIAGRMKRKNGDGSWMVYNGCDEEYANQVTAEHKVNVKKNGSNRQEWKLKHSHGDNHYLDTEVYAMAAADILGVRTLHLQSAENPDETGEGTTGNDGKNSKEDANEGWLKQYNEWL